MSPGREVFISLCVFAETFGFVIFKRSNSSKGMSAKKVTTLLVCKSERDYEVITIKSFLSSLQILTSGKHVSNQKKFSFP